MSRYVGPSWKISRRLGYSVLETGKELAKRPYGPGQHGQGRKKKPTEYGKQLIEKQKLRLTYGVNERQFRRLFMIAKKKKGVVTGLAFMQILESRLDNVVYRLGLANTRRQARQLVTHGHITVDGQKVDIASFLVKPNEKISVREKSRGLSIIKESVASHSSTVAYVAFEAEKLEGILVRLPERNELTPEINEAQIVEYYNRLI